MRHPVSGPALGLAVALLAGAAAAQDIYQWKDDRGVTHYSETPPASGEYRQRRITSAGASQGQAAPSAAAPAAADDAPAPVAASRAGQCETARGNIEALRADAPVQQDDGNGEPRTLSDEERAAQLEFAQAAVKAYCD